jgi:hypothetical protein
MDAKYQPGIPVFTRGVLLGGGLAGICGAILMGLAGSAYIASVGGGWSTVMQAIAGTFYKSMAFVGGPGVTAIGVLTHLFVGGALGMLFAVLTRGFHSPVVLFFLGIPYGIAIWVFMTFVTLPVFDWVMFPRVQMMATVWFFLHWIFGAFTGLFLPYLRRLLTPGVESRHLPRVRQVA